MPEKNYYSSELYDFYKQWLGKAIDGYRQNENNRKGQEWLKTAHRASTLTDLFLHLSQQNKRSGHDR